MYTYLCDITVREYRLRLLTLETIVWFRQVCSETQWHQWHPCVRSLSNWQRSRLLPCSSCLLLFHPTTPYFTKISSNWALINPPWFVKYSKHNSWMCIEEGRLHTRPHTPTHACMRMRTHTYPCMYVYACTHPPMCVCIPLRILHALAQLPCN